jgi:tetratricopeptide (TPR) repeat protein
LTREAAMRGSASTVAGLCAAFVVVACAGPFARPTGTPVIGRYDELSAPLAERYETARRCFDSGDFGEARDLVAGLVAAAPDHVGVGVLFQELELVQRGSAARTELLARAVAAFEAQPGAARAVLAARIASDGGEARAWLERALELDPQCAWARYGLAHLAARRGDWGDADEELSLALALDPFLPPARRLQAMLLARDGRRTEAIAAFEAWLEDCAGDPRVSLREWAEAELDLATLQVLAQKTDEARERLASLSLDGEAAVRALCVRAAAEQGAGRAEAALHAAREAEALAPDAALPWLQEAILRQSWLDDPAGAEAAWRRLLASSQTGGDLGRVLLGMRARLALERAERRRERAQGSPR